MVYTLYNRSGSGGFVIEAVLELAGTDYHLESIASLPNEPLSEKIGHLNAWGQVPVLVMDDGTVMTELAAILAYLAQAEPGLREGPNLWIDSDPLFLRWCVFLCVNAYEGILRRTYPDRFCVTTGDETTDQALITSVCRAAEARTHAAFQCLERQIHEGGFILGARMSACDVLLAMLYAWHNQRPDLPKCTAITAHVARHPVVQPIWHKNFETRLDYKWHRDA